MGRIRKFLLAATLLACSSAQGQIALRAASEASSASGATPVFVASANLLVNSTSVAVARPAGAAQNDILIAQVTVKGVRPVTAPAPAGSWTLIDQTSTGTAGDEVTQAVFWRRVGVIGSEPASYTWSWTGSDRATGAIAAYRNVTPFLDPIEASGVRSTNASTTITLPTITTLTPNAMLVALLASSRAANTHSLPTGMTTEHYEISSGAGPNGVTSSMNEQLQAAAGTTGAKAAATSSGDDNIAVLLALRGAAPLTIAVPTGTVAGDIMVASIAVRPCSAVSGAACTLTTAAPAGWTSVATIDRTTGGAFGNRLHVYWREATAADAAPGASFTWTFGGPVHTGATGGIISFSGVDTTSPIVAQAGQSTASGYPHATPSINTGTQANTMLVSSHAANAAGSWTPQAGMTEQMDVASLPLTNNAGISLSMHTETRAATGATGTRTATLSNPPTGNTGTAHLLALKPAVTLDHFNISHAATGVACVDQTITITAHDASHAAVDANSTTITLATSNGRGTWTGILAGGGVLNDPTAGDGAATYTFAAGSNQVSLRFRYANLAATSEVFGFNVSNGSVSEATGSANVSDDPSFTMSQAGFIFSVVPTQLSGKPSNVGFNAAALRVQAVQTDTKTGSCTTLFASQNRIVQLGAECNNPTACAAAQLSVNGASIATSNDNAGSGAAAYTNVTLAFNASSQADTVISYPAAGQLSLHARYDLDTGIAGFEMVGATSPFAVRPFGLRITGADSATALTTSATPAATDTVFTRAGANFNATLTAVQWKAGDDANADGVPDNDAQISANAAALNFGMETVPASAMLAHTLNAPAGGNAGTLGGSTNFTGFAAATKTQAVSWSEVGFINLGASSANYLGTGQNVTNSAAGLTGVGRFRPDHFLVSASSLSNRAGACGPTTFTYMNEGLSLAFTLQARNTAGVKTENYEGGYARLNPATIAQLGLGAVGVNPGGANVDLSTRLDPSLGSAGSFTDGEASVTATVPLSRATPDLPDGPFTNTRIGVAPVDPDTVALRSADLNLDVDGAGGTDHVQLGAGTIIRYGRLRVQNAVGSEKLPLPIPMELQYWNGAGFATNTLDSCTSIPRSAIVLGGYSGALDPAGGNCKTFLQQDPIAFTNGTATPTLAAPSVAGSVLVTPNLRPAAAGSYCDNATSGEDAATAVARSYLLGRWSDAANPDGNASTAYDDNPSSRAAFGFYGSQPNNFIYFRENF